MATIDLNADLGEGCGSDDELLTLVSSASIACGAHAGDGRTMRVAIEAALKRGVSIGAHPGYHDRESFGRKETGARPDEIKNSVLAQLEAFATACTDVGATPRHVKPHGALYNRATRDPAAAESIARAVEELDPSLIILCMPGSRLLQAAETIGLRVAREAFLDRAYQSAGVLLARTAPGAVISDRDAAAARAERIVFGHTVTCVDGTDCHVRAESLCVHGDNSNAVELVRSARSRLERLGVVIARFRGT